MTLQRAGYKSSANRLRLGEHDAHYVKFTLASPSHRHDILPRNVIYYLRRAYSQSFGPNTAEKENTLALV